MSELKPCPFCGCNAGVLEREQLNGPTLYKIVCNSKTCRGHDHAGNVGAWLENGWRESREIAAQIWNRRAERTCRMQFDDGELRYRCSRCGCLSEAYRDADGKWYAPDYCTGCGAKVEHRWT